MPPRRRAARIADRAAFMLDGQLVEFGVAAQIFTNPREDRTREYVEGRFG